MTTVSIPLSYNLRNLAVRKGTTIMTALGIALTVAVLLAVMALVEGLRASFVAGGHPLHLLVMRKGATSELTSILNPQAFQTIRSKPGIARTASGEPAASLELVTGINLENEESPGGMNVTLRGLSVTGFEMRGARIAEGRLFRPGQREVVVGKSIAAKYPRARMGQTLKFGRGDWLVVGIVDGGRAAVNSEVLGDLNQVAGDYNRSEAQSSVLLRATDEVSLRALENDLVNDARLTVIAQTERSYYEAQMVSAAPVQYLGTFIAAVLAIGSSFAAMNTMYAAIARRSAEIGTLRVLGFSRGSILLSFFLESVALSVTGGLLGCALVLPLNSFETGIGSMVTFSEMVFQFQVTPAIMGIGVAFAALMGAAGGFFPARLAAKKEILSALRGA
ncbi:MAG: ABC transporter permease [Bryobacteraceae bacterium]|nr:ABC transporter permease [Bryobacteraceae bacterium]